MGKPISYTVHLLRVGETSWEADSRITGQTDLPMTESATDEIVEAIRNYDPAVIPSYILTSNEEASQTCAKLLLSSPETKLKTLESIKNVGMGLWEGVTLNDLQDRCPSAFGQWQDAPQRITAPEGESFFDAQDRLVTTLIKALSKAKGPHPSVAIVLRPWAWVLMRCWLNSEKINNVWAQLDSAIEVESFELMKSYMDSYESKAKAGA